jgi:cation transport regulator ChaC
MSRLAVFGYASLVSRASAGETLGREVQACPPARLRGWRRRWSLVRDNHRAEKGFARADDGSLPDFVLGLNVEPGGEDAQAPNGVLIELTEAELDRLDLREIRYSRVDVTDAVDAPGAERFDRVVTFSAKPENHAPDPPPGAVILRNYAETIAAAFGELGPEHHRLYLETTGPPPVEVIDAVLVRDAIPPGNPRAW